MSSSIWTRCAAASEIGPLRVTAWRAVEAQHQIATRKLVDSDAEQQLLEELLDASKPPVTSRRRLHYLLSTPFRYPPLRHGSRFASRFERSIWYGSETLATMFAEVAYYRFVFLDGTSADLGALSMDLTAFSVSIRTSIGLDLTLPPFAAERARLSSPSKYATSQQFGASMREASVEAFRYFSARSSEGVNVGVINEAAFASARPRNLETWHSVAQRSRIEFVRRDYFHRASFTFGLEEFLVDGKLPAPAV